jgi:hypothetical protein
MSAGKAAIKSGLPRSMTRAEVYFLAFFGGCRFVALSFASRVLPSTPLLFHSVDRQDLRGHNGGSSTSGIHRWPHTSHTATLASVHPIAPDYSYLPLGQKALFIPCVAVYN